MPNVKIIGDDLRTVSKTFLVRQDSAVTSENTPVATHLLFRGKNDLELIQGSNSIFLKFRNDFENLELEPEERIHRAV